MINQSINWSNKQTNHRKQRQWKNSLTLSHTQWTLLICLFVCLFFGLIEDFVYFLKYFLFTKEDKKILLSLQKNIGRKKKLVRGRLPYFGCLFVCWFGSHPSIHPSLCILFFLCILIAFNPSKTNQPTKQQQQQNPSIKLARKQRWWWKTIAKIRGHWAYHHHIYEGCA